MGGGLRRGQRQREEHRLGTDVTALDEYAIAGLSGAFVAAVGSLFVASGYAPATALTAFLVGSFYWHVRGRKRTQSLVQTCLCGGAYAAAFYPLYFGYVSLIGVLDGVGPATDVMPELFAPGNVVPPLVVTFAVLWYRSRGHVTFGTREIVRAVGFLTIAGLPTGIVVLLSWNDLQQRLAIQSRMLAATLITFVLVLGLLVRWLGPTSAQLRVRVERLGRTTVRSSSAALLASVVLAPATASSSGLVLIASIVGLAVGLASVVSVPGLGPLTPAPPRLRRAIAGATVVLLVLLVFYGTGVAGATTPVTLGPP
jgi:hypothetical protein